MQFNFGEILDIWGSTFKGPYLSSRGNKYILVPFTTCKKRLKQKRSSACLNKGVITHRTIEDSDSLMEEIDTFLASDDSIPPGIDSDGYNSEEVNFFLEYEPDLGKLTRVVVEDIFGEPRVHVPNVLPTHPTFSLDSDFTPSDNFSGSDLVVSFPSRNRNKTFDPGISIDVQSKRFLSLNEFSI
ncbi:hypothetical protein Tco_0679890 [Tanacetum coccineum]|uniref:Uncharacterized protein n=1 Tax=Tanacetum coccineum TaxID=301880 RepID=A0ABQ4XKF0_9ASTR